jgi:hypothetical protein
MGHGRSFCGGSVRVHNLSGESDNRLSGFANIGSYSSACFGQRKAELIVLTPTFPNLNLTAAIVLGGLIVKDRNLYRLQYLDSDKISQIKISFQQTSMTAPRKQNQF